MAPPTPSECGAGSGCDGQKWSDIPGVCYEKGSDTRLVGGSQIKAALEECSISLTDLEVSFYPFVFLPWRRPLVRNLLHGSGFSIWR